MTFQFVNLLIILVICGQLPHDTIAKHRLHRFRCPVLKQCTVHKHKICGSDGKFYPSHCHLRKASCEQGNQLRAVHRHQCDLVNGAFDYEQHGGNELINQTPIELNTEDRLNNRNPFNGELQTNGLNENTTTSRTVLSKEDEGQSKSTIEECRTEQYELMKHQLLQKVMNNDLALLFAQLDENKDGHININELWKKSSVFKPTGSSSCLITDLLQFEDRNSNDLLDYGEFQNAFRKFSSNTAGTVDVNMVSLDESLSVNMIQTHLHDNIEIRCDIVGKPLQPKIKWYRNSVDLATLNIPNIKPTGSSSCLITDLLQFEDRNSNDLLDYGEFQNAFRKFSSNTAGTVDVNMVSLDESLSVNMIQTHLHDNIEIRCDIVGKPLQPKIKWYRNSVDLATLNIPNIKVFNDGLLYLSNVIVAFAGNYTCQSENNSIIKQTHILKVIMTPLVKVTPHFHWANIGASFSISCEYQCLFDQVHIAWFKNDEPIVNNQRITMLNNNTKLELSELSRSDTAAYTCRAYNQVDGAYSQDTVSLVVQDEPVSEQSAETFKSRLWIFHRNGVSIHSIGCSGLLHEMDARDFIPINQLTLCGGVATRDDQTSKSTEDGICEWSENGILLNEKIYIGQPNLNRLIVFDTQHLSVSQVIATDPRPMRLHLVPGIHEQRIWLLCYGNDLQHRLVNLEEKETGTDDKSNDEESLFGRFDSNLHIHLHNSDQYLTIGETAAVAVENEKKNDQFEWKSTSQEQQLHNRKTIQILRLGSNALNNGNVIHLQPINGHFDLVYNLFVPKSSDEYHLNNGVVSNMDNTMKNGGQEFNSAQRYAFASHYDERSLIKIDMESFKYIKSINLADCHPIDAVFTQFGLLIVQCETPVTHQLNGQLILDQITDSIIDYNFEIKAHKAFLSPNEQFLISIFHNTTEFGAISSTIIVQKVTQSGLELLYDVKTTLIIVDCDFVWKRGNFDALLVSASENREDAIYLTLVDGKVELINGVGRPGKNSKRKIAIKGTNKLGAITSEQSVFVVNLKTNRVQCETDQQHLQPKASSHPKSGVILERVRITSDSYDFILKILTK